MIDIILGTCLMVIVICITLAAVLAIGMLIYTVYKELQ